MTTVGTIIILYIDVAVVDRHGPVRAPSLVGILSFNRVLDVAGRGRMHKLHAARARHRIHRLRGRVRASHLPVGRTPTRLVHDVHGQRSDDGRR